MTMLKTLQLGTTEIYFLKLTDTKLIHLRIRLPVL